MLRASLFPVFFFVLLFGGVGINTAKAEGFWEEAGLGIASVVGTTIYSPIKLHYAALGAVTGGVAWIVTGGNTELAQTIWKPALSGDYVITPKNLKDLRSTSTEASVP